MNIFFALKGSKLLFLFMLSAMSDSISLLDISVKSAKCDTGIGSSGGDLVNNTHCSGERSLQIRENY